MRLIPLKIKNFKIIMSLINQAFSPLITHPVPTVRTQFPNYSNICPYCHGTNTFPVTNDGGSIKGCTNCNKTFKSLVNNTQIKVRSESDRIKNDCVYIQNTLYSADKNTAEELGRSNLSHDQIHPYQ